MWVNGQRRARPEHSVGHSGHSQAPLLARFVGKLVLDVLPAALASVVGGILFAQFHIGNSPAPQPLAQQVTPASAEVLSLVRDEHAQIVGYLKSQMVAEKKRLAAEDAETAQAVEDAKVEKVAEQKATEENAAAEKVAQAAQEKMVQNSTAAENAADPNAAEVRVAAQTAARHSPALAAAKPTLPRARPAAAAVASSGAPLVIAQADQVTQPDDAGASTGRLARDPDSLLAKTLDLKDQVVAATRHAVSAIGDVFTSVGEHIGGALPNGHQFSSDS